MIRYMELCTEDGYRVVKSEKGISVLGTIGGYRNFKEDEFFYYTDLLEISDEQKVEFECRVREILREVEVLEGKL